MTPKQFRELMCRQQKTVVDVAQAIGCHPNTVYKFLAGEPTSRMTNFAVQTYGETLKEKEKERKAKKSA